MEELKAIKQVIRTAMNGKEELRAKLRIKNKKS